MLKGYLLTIAMLGYRTHTNISKISDGIIKISISHEVTISSLAFNLPCTQLGNLMHTHAHIRNV